MLVSLGISGFLWSEDTFPIAIVEMLSAIVMHKKGAVYQQPPYMRYINFSLFVDQQLAACSLISTNCTDDVRSVAQLIEVYLDGIFST